MTKKMHGYKKNINARTYDEGWEITSSSYFYFVKCKWPMASEMLRQSLSLPAGLNMSRLAPTTSTTLC